MRKLPTKIKERQGTLRPSRQIKGEIEFESLKAKLVAPEWWAPETQKMFLFYVDELKKVGLLFKTDLASLQRYCYAIEQAQEAEKHLGEQSAVILRMGTNGEEYQVINEWFHVWMKATTQIDKLSAKFGFSPVDKTRISLAVIEEKPKMSLLK